MISKVIHYCWFGNDDIPEREKKCIESWKKYFSGYELKFWNEKNFDYQKCNYAKQAYNEGQYAFVSDYARAKILYEYGGLYLDTDVKVLKEFPKSASPKGFMGFERKAFLGTAVLACEAKDDNIGKLLQYYETHDFIQEDGSFDNIANVSILTDIMKEKGLVLGGEKQKVDGFEIYNREVFYPKKLDETEFKITEETCAIHMCTNSWLSEREKRRGNNKLWIEIARPVLRICRTVLTQTVGKEKTRRIEIKFRNKLR